MTTLASDALPTSPRPDARLIVKKGPQTGIIFPITTDHTVLGREESCDIVIRDPEVSRRHVAIVWENNTFMVQDQGSTNGSFLNGTQLTQPLPLQNSHVIGLGQTSLRFEIDHDGSDDQAVSGSRQTAGGSPQTGPSRKLGGNRIFAFTALGCGCLIFLCICSVTGVVGLDLIDWIDLGLGLDLPPG